MPSEPLVSVLMPVYNGEEYLDAAVQSILSQSFEDFELIVIDDGSTDNTQSMLEVYARQDVRTKIFTQENRGLTFTLNRGLNLVRGTYLARMDADDVSNPERLEKQVAFMEQNKDVVLLGSMLWTMSGDGSLLWIEQPPWHDTSIRWQLLFDNPFTHSAVMLRMETMKRYSLEYRQEAILAEDYDLWSRLLDYGRGYNLDMPLLKRRFHDRQISENTEARTVSGKSATRIAKYNLSKMGYDLAEDDVDTLRLWSHHFPRVLDTADELLCFVLLDILETFCQNPGLNQKQLQLIRGRVALRLLMARSNVQGGLYWKFRVIQRLRPTDLISVVKYIQYRQKLLGQFPSPKKYSGMVRRR